MKRDMNAEKWYKHFNSCCEFENSLENGFIGSYLVKCPYCGGAAIVKNGKANGKQILAGNFQNQGKSKVKHDEDEGN